MLQKFQAFLAAGGGGEDRAGEDGVAACTPTTTSPGSWALTTRGPEEWARENNSIPARRRAAAVVFSHSVRRK